MTSMGPSRSAKSGSGSLVGQVIMDRFRIVAPIARGGMGAIYKAEQAPLGRLVAIKILSPKHDEEKDPEFRKRFFLEAATLAKLTHPNTVTVFDYGQSENLYFIVMELLDGITMKKALKDDGPFSSERTIHVAKQLCRSLREAHRLGVIHRDMKPGNVMLLEQGDEQDYVKVLDFGLVKEIEEEGEPDLTQAGVFMGSPKYMSPEQIQGDHRVDGRSDIYSIGVMLYELLTGRPPFLQEKQVHILMDHLNAAVPPMTVPEGLPPIQPDLEGIVLKCLAKNPDHRFADMDELLVCLKATSGESSGLLTSGAISLSGASLSSISGVQMVNNDLRISSPGSFSAPHLGASGAFSGPVSGVPYSGPPSKSSPLPLVLGGLALLVALGTAGYLMLGEGRSGAGNLVQMPEHVSTPPPGPSEGVPSEGAPVDGEDVVAASPASPDHEAAAAEGQSDPATIRSVLVELVSRPSGAMVRLGEQEFGPTPTQIELTGDQAAPGEQLDFVFSRDGHRNSRVSRNVPASGTLEVDVRMRRIHRPAVRPTSETPAARPQHVATPNGYRDSPY